ncbi:MAG: hypothetical protein DRJ42_01380 [Deltaproteobacteria bacterium]|nr:MAG: hypothetical protein DRJ42_01380 [Deltaproteobacteria bacterium]
MVVAQPAAGVVDDETLREEVETQHVKGLPAQAPAAADAGIGPGPGRAVDAEGEVLVEGRRRARLVGFVGLDARLWRIRFFLAQSGAGKREGDGQKSEANEAKHSSHGHGWEQAGPFLILFCLCVRFPGSLAVD